MRPRALDLFCGAGGVTVGLQRAGFEVWGVDLVASPRYPGDHFTQADVLDLPMWFLAAFDFIWASPPCQAYNQLANPGHPRLIEPVRELLRASGLPYAIENIPGAPLLDPVTLCGSSLGLGVRRHRGFETNWTLFVPPCAHGLQSSNPHRIRAPYEPAENAIVPVYGGGQSGFPVERCREAMGIPWMTLDELKEAIPPAYSELIGAQLLAHLSYVPAARNPGGGGG